MMASQPGPPRPRTPPRNKALLQLICPLKGDYFNRKYIFQPLIFRGHVSFPGSKGLLTIGFPK